MPAFSRDLGIDLGTLYTRIADSSGLLVEEPTVAALDALEPKVVEFGKAAREMEGRVPENIEVVRPLQNGVVADYEVAEALLAYLLRSISGPFRFSRPRVMISVPYGVTSVEARAVHEAALEAGSREAHLIQQPLAAALGADLPVASPSGNMVICLGAGVSQAAVITMYSIVSAESLREGGFQMDEAIIAYVRKKYGVLLGPATAEQLKIKIGAAVPQEKEESLEVQGQDQVSGMPRLITLTTGEIVEALQEPLSRVVKTARRVLEKTPPELISDIIDRGVALCGGGALLRGVDKLFTQALGLPAYLVDDPPNCVAIGAARAVGMYPVLRRSLPSV